VFFLLMKQRQLRRGQLGSNPASKLPAFAAAKIQKPQAEL
jgi:hypothetical protein